MQLILNDGLPKNISFPLRGTVLEDALKDIVPAHELGLYLLYISGVQLDYYDPLTSTEKRYPVLVADNGPPPLCSNTINRLIEDQVRRQRASLPLEARLNGTARAEAQLAGDDRAESTTLQAPELRLPPMSLIVLPVKTRFRTKVGKLIETQALRALKNWFSCKPELKAKQRPLVLTYDEESESVTSKFADDWTDESRPRFYY